MRPLGDRRSLIRFEVVGSLRGSLELSKPASVVNIGTGGALIRTPLPVAVGSLQTIYLNLDGGGRPAPVTGRVRRVTRLDADRGSRAYAVGVQFESLSTTLNEALAQLLMPQSD